MPEFILTFVLLKQTHAWFQWLNYCMTHYSDPQLDMEIFFNHSISSQHVLVNMILGEVSLCYLLCLKPTKATKE